MRPDHSGLVAHYRAGTLTSAKRGSPWHGTGFGARRFTSWGSERDDSAGWNHLAGSGVEPLRAITAGPRSGWGQSEHLIQVTTHRFGVVPTPCTTGLIKGGWRSRPSSLSRSGSPTRLLHPPFFTDLLVDCAFSTRPSLPFFTNSPADSAFFTASSSLSTHCLLTPPLSTH